MEKCGGQERGIAEEEGIGGFLWRGGAGEVWLGWIPFPAVDLAWPCRSSSAFFLCLFGGHGRTTPGWILAVGWVVIAEMEGADYSRASDATDNSRVTGDLKVWMDGYSFTRGWKWIMCILSTESYIWEYVSSAAFWRSGYR
jgi:hypothetical protein